MLKLRRNIVILLIVAVCLSSCVLTPGSILIREKYIDKGFDISFLDWDKHEDCELFLNSDDVLEISGSLKKGSISIIVMYDGGDERYSINKMGNYDISLEINRAGKYNIYLYGDNATGKINISK